MRTNKLAMMVMAGLIGGASVSTAQASEAWEWSITPYLWFSSVEMDLNTQVPPGGLGNDTNFSNILDDITFAAEIHAEGKGERFGMLGDLMFVSLSKDRDFAELSTDTDLDASIIELAGTWSLGEERYRGFDLIFGLRNFSTDISIDLNPVDPARDRVNLDAGEDYLDFMIGIRYFAEFSERWGMVLRADGSWGDTEGTTNLAANFTYKTNSGAWAFGYRYMDTGFKVRDNDLDDDLELDLALSGPVVSYTWIFK